MKPGFPHFTCLSVGPGFHISRAFGRPGFHISRALRRVGFHISRAFGGGGAGVSHFTGLRGDRGFTFHGPSGGRQGFTFHAGPSGDQGFTFHGPSEGRESHGPSEVEGTGVSHFTGLRGAFHWPSGGPGFHISWAFGGPGFFTGLRGARVSQSVPRRRKARSLATKTLTEASCVSTSGHTCAVHVELQLVGILSTNHGILTGKHMRVVVFFCSSQRTTIGRLPP